MSVKTHRAVNAARSSLVLRALLSSLFLSSLFLCGVSAQGDEPVKRDLFVGGEGGYHTYRIPALVVSKQGALLAFCEGRKTSRSDHGDVDLVLRRSADQGRTWSDIQLVQEGGEAKITIGNPCPVLDAETGVIWLTFTRDNDDVFVTSSDDDGRRWSTPRRITAEVKLDGWGWYATGPGNGIQLTAGPHRGRLVIPCDHRLKDVADRSQSTHSHVIYSDDHGRTWRLGGSAAKATNECAVAELSDGSLLLNMRSLRGRGCRAVARSEDGGRSWLETRDDPALIEPVCQASLIRAGGTQTDGLARLVFSNPASRSGRRRLTVRQSRDDGASWSDGLLVEAGSSAYSCLAALPAGKIGLLYERDEYRKITFVELSLDSLSAGALR